MGKGIQPESCKRVKEQVWLNNNTLPKTKNKMSKLYLFNALIFFETIISNQYPLELKIITGVATTTKNFSSFCKHK